MVSHSATDGSSWSINLMSKEICGTAVIAQPADTAIGCINSSVATARWSQRLRPWVVHFDDKHPKMGARKRRKLGMVHRLSR